jgi:hypothetical protein
MSAFGPGTQGLEPNPRLQLTRKSLGGNCAYTGIGTVQRTSDGYESRAATTRARFRGSRNH